MDLVILALLAFVLALVAAYAQLRIAAFTRGAGKVVATRLFLFLVGLGFGWVVSAGVPGGSFQALVFVAAFGAVHVPAAIILFIKQRRGAGRT